MSDLIHIALFASGTGSNARNIIRYFHGHASIRVKLLVCNNAAAGALQIAQEAGIETLVPEKHLVSDGPYLLQQLRQRNIHFVVLAGYLKMIPAELAMGYERKMLNIHPALLPRYGGKGMYGRHVHEAVKAAGDHETGITVHYVNAVYDDGEIVAQKKTALLPTDSAADIEAKVRALEMQWFPVIIESVILQKTPL